MGLWGAIKGIGKGLGKVAKKAAPIVGLVPGVGTLAAAGLGAGGALLSGGNLSDIIKSGASGAAGGLIGGVGKIGSIGSSLGGFIKDNPELIGAGVSAIQGARTQGKRDDIREEILARDAADRARREGFLGKIDIEGLRNIQSPNLDRVFADQSNPFARGIRGVSSQSASGVSDPSRVDAFAAEMAARAGKGAPTRAEILGKIGKVNGVSLPARRRKAKPREPDIHPRPGRV